MNVPLDVEIFFGNFDFLNDSLNIQLQYTVGVTHQP